MLHLQIRYIVGKVITVVKVFSHEFRKGCRKESLEKNDRVSVGQGKEIKGMRRQPRQRGPLIPRLNVWKVFARTLNWSKMV